jgi:hypothetical protein
MASIERTDSAPLAAGGEIKNVVADPARSASSAR